jgi:hypothetical protein
MMVNNGWLVGDLPLRKILSWEYMTVPIYGKRKNVPNHQPVYNWQSQPDASLWPQPDHTQSIQLSPSYRKKLEDSHFAWQHHAASMNPSHAGFFGKHVGILFSPTHPPRHPTSCLTGRDAKVPGATALHRLGFQ